MQEVIEFVNTAARWVGYTVLGMFALAFLAILKGQIKSEMDVGNRKPQKADTDTTVNDIIEENLENPERFTELDYQPKASCSWDWSMGRSVDKRELLNIKAELESAGYFVHPFPRDPHTKILDDDWHWGRKNMGLWTQRPRFYAKTDDGEEVEVKPDLSKWEVETRSGMPSSVDDYGYMDKWERENIHGIGNGGD